MQAPDLNAIRARMAELAAERRATAIPYSEVKRRRHKGRPQTERTKRKLSEITRQRRKLEALADDDAHPLRIARVNFGEDGLSQRELAERALVAVNVVTNAERGEPISDLSAKRLARALRTSRTALGLR